MYICTRYVALYLSSFDHQELKTDHADLHKYLKYLLHGGIGDVGVFMQNKFSFDDGPQLSPERQDETIVPK